MDYFNGLDSTRKDMNPHLTLLKYGCLAIILALLYFKVGLSFFLVKFPHFYIAKYYLLGVVSQLQLALNLLG